MNLIQVNLDKPFKLPMIVLCERHLRSYCLTFERTAGEIPRHASILRRLCAYYSTRILFTGCCRLQCVTV